MWKKSFLGPIFYQTQWPLSLQGFQGKIITKCFGPTGGHCLTKRWYDNKWKNYDAANLPYFSFYHHHRYPPKIGTRVSKFMISHHRSTPCVQVLVRVRAKGGVRIISHARSIIGLYWTFSEACYSGKKCINDMCIPWILTNLIYPTAHPYTPLPIRYWTYPPVKRM